VELQAQLVVLAVLIPIPSTLLRDLIVLAEVAPPQQGLSRAVLVAHLLLRAVSIRLDMDCDFQSNVDA